MRNPDEGRLRALHAASLRTSVSPLVAGGAICQIVESESWQLRYPVGSDTVPFIEWRMANLVLDLQESLHHCYHNRGYDDFFDYRRAPTPPLEFSEGEEAKLWLSEQGKR